MDALLSFKEVFFDLTILTSLAIVFLLVHFILYRKYKRNQLMCLWISFSVGLGINLLLNVIAVKSEIDDKRKIEVFDLNKNGQIDQEEKTNSFEKLKEKIHLQLDSRMLSIFGPFVFIPFWSGFIFIMCIIIRPALIKKGYIKGSIRKQNEN